jgi:hypothetical protein
VTEDRKCEKAHSSNAHLKQNYLFYSGHFERVVSDSQTGVEYSTSWQTRKLYPSPPVSPTESKVDARSMARLSLQTRALPPSPPPSGSTEGHGLDTYDLPAVEDMSTLTGSKFGASLGPLSSVDDDAAATEDMDILTASKGDVMTKSDIQTLGGRQMTSVKMFSEDDVTTVGDHDILTPSTRLMSASATAVSEGDVTAVVDENVLMASKGQVTKIVDTAAVEDEGFMTASKGQMTTEAGVPPAADAAAAEDEAILAASKGHVRRVSAADVPAIEDEGHLAGSKGKVTASAGILSNTNGAALEYQKTLTANADDTMQTAESPSWKTRQLAPSLPPVEGNEPTESSAEMQTTPPWMTQPDEPWTPPSQQHLDGSQKRSDE